MPRLDSRDPRARGLRLRIALRKLDIALARGAAVEWDSIVERVGAELGVLKSTLTALPGRVAYDDIDPAALCDGLTADSIAAWPKPKAEPDPESDADASGPTLPVLHPADPRAVRARTEADWLELQLADAKRDTIPLREAVAAIGNLYGRIRAAVARLDLSGDAKRAVNDLLRSIVETEESGIFAETEMEERLIETASAALRAPPLMKVPEWSDTYRHLPAVNSAIAGPMRVERVEVARGPMMAVTEPGVRVITLMAATQVTKTSVLESAIGYYAHLDPCPILAVFPKTESAVAWSKDRLSPMVSASPALRDLIRDGRSRVSGDTISHKSFPGGSLNMVSAGSPANLAMRAIRVVVLDEIDKYEVSKEGEPVTLAEERTATFNQNSLCIRACSPTWAETSRIYKSYLDSDMRKPFVKCPACGELESWQFFRNVHWRKTPEGEHFPETAKLKCSHCDHEWTEQERQAVIARKGGIRWRQTKGFFCCEERQTPEQWEWDADNQIDRATCKHCGEMAVSNHHAGFQISKLFAPQISIVEIAKKFIAAKDTPEGKATFRNTILGEPHEAESVKIVEPNVLASRAENYAAEVPKDVVLLTVGIDVQSGGTATEGRFELEVMGWGLGEESWSILYEVMQGNPSQPDAWKRLDAVLDRPFKHELGFDFYIMAGCIDSGGHNTQEVYSYARSRRNLFAVKGASERGVWGPIWPPASAAVKKWRDNSFKPTIISVNTAKRWIQQRLEIDTPGPGYCHFPKGRPVAYFEQFSAEQEVTEIRGGSSFRRFKAIRGRANEALDVRVYNVAALHALKEKRGITAEGLHAKMLAALARKRAS